MFFTFLLGSVFLGALFADSCNSSSYDKEARRKAIEKGDPVFRKYDMHYYLTVKPYKRVMIYPLNDVLSVVDLNYNLIMYYDGYVDKFAREKAKAEGKYYYMGRVRGCGALCMKRVSDGKFVIVRYKGRSYTLLETVVEWKWDEKWNRMAFLPTGEVTDVTEQGYYVH